MQFKGLGADPSRLRSETALLALKASYGPGLIAGALLLIANNPSKKWEQLPYAKLARLALLPLAAAVLGALAGALVGRYAPSADIREIAAETFLPAYRKPFTTVWGIHMGSYAGAALGTIAAIVAVRRSRAPKPPATIQA